MVLFAFIEKAEGEVIVEDVLPKAGPARSRPCDFDHSSAALKILTDLPKAEEAHLSIFIVFSNNYNFKNRNNINTF